jgi:hypothetical protein
VVKRKGLDKVVAGCNNLALISSLALITSFSPGGEMKV